MMVSTSDSLSAPKAREVCALLVIVVMLFTLPRLGATSSIVVIAKETCLPRASICLEQYDTSIIITYESTVAVSMVGCAWQKAWMNP